MRDKKTNIVLRVSEQMKSDVERLAKKQRRSVSNYLRCVIEDQIKIEEKESQ